MNTRTAVWFAVGAVLLMGSFGLMVIPEYSKAVFDSLGDEGFIAVSIGGVTLSCVAFLVGLWKMWTWTPCITPPVVLEQTTQQAEKVPKQPISSNVYDLGAQRFIRRMFRDE